MAKSKIKPLGENVLIQPKAAEKKTKTGIYLPENNAEGRRQQGVVRAIGDDKKISVKKGDSVIFKQYGSSEEIAVEGEEYIIVSYKDILAVIR